MPLVMDYVIDSNEQDEYEVKYKGEVIGKERYHELAVSMITGHIAGRCERAEARVAELESHAGSKSCLCGDWPQQSPWLHCPWCGGTLPADHKCSECGFAHAPGGNTCYDRYSN